MEPVQEAPDRELVPTAGVKEQGEERNPQQIHISGRCHGCDDGAGTWSIP